MDKPTPRGPASKPSPVFDWHGPPAAIPKPSERGLPDRVLDPDRPLLKAVDSILHHLSTVQPREEDLDLAFNADAAGNNAPTKTLTILAGATGTFKMQARQGYNPHIKRLQVRGKNPAADLSLTTLTASKGGVPVARVLDTHFARPIMLDLDDDITVNVVNGSAGTIVYEVEASGWLRPIRREEQRR